MRSCNDVVAADDEMVVVVVVSSCFVGDGGKTEEDSCSDLSFVLKQRWRFFQNIFDIFERSEDKTRKKEKREVGLDW